MKHNLKRKLEEYKTSVSQQSLDPAKIKRLGLSSAAALAAMVTMPVELTSQVVCGNSGAPTRTVGACEGWLGNFYSNYCALFDFDGDGTNDLQIRYYNYAGYPAGMYVEPLTGSTLGNVYKGPYAGSYGQTFPANPSVISNANAFYIYGFVDRFFAVPLSGGNGFGFITLDKDLYNLSNGTHQVNHPVTGQPICCTTYGGVVMWGAQTGITSYNDPLIEIQTDDIVECPGSILPVELSKFEASAKENAVLLEWTTETEINNAGFAIERSIDGKDFREIAFVDGQGLSTRSVDYVYKDIEVKEGETYYYRLRQVDYDGRYDFSEVRAAKLENTSLQINIAPIPAYDFLNINITSNLREEVSFNIYSVNGVELSKKTTLQVRSDNTIIDISNIPNGIYFLKVTSGSEVHYKKFMVQK